MQSGTIRHNQIFGMFPDAGEQGEQAEAERRQETEETETEKEQDQA